MSNFVLKIVACISMFIGHIPFAIPSLAIPCIYIGRLSFPIFAFLISQGYIHTKNFGKYLKRLLLLALISQIPAYLLFFNNFSKLYLNIFFTLSFGLLSIRFIDKGKNKVLSYIAVLLIAILAEFLKFDFGLIGILMIVLFYLTKSNKNIMVISETILMCILFSKKLVNITLNTQNIRYILFQLLFMVISLIFIIFYNGKLGKNNKKIKTAFYLFYPIHLSLLCLIKYL